MDPLTNDAVAPTDRQYPHLAMALTVRFATLVIAAVIVWGYVQLVIASRP